ncbi:MAG: hypothetical protein JST32_02795 [Bacteroidetes bacterium]|nr:hypothetical protein [Bacteroidota bacterium]
MKVKFSALALSALLLGCSNMHEVVMPFRNLGYSGERLLPVSENSDEFTFRAWINYSTNIDRVYTISYSKDLGYSGEFSEIELTPGRKGHNKYKFKQRTVVPHSGFEKFITKVRSLNLLNVSTSDSVSIPFDTPVPIMVVEIKMDNKYHHFSFPSGVDQKKAEKYEAVRNLISGEFDTKFYFPDGFQPSFN